MPFPPALLALYPLVIHTNGSIRAVLSQFLITILQAFHWLLMFSCGEWTSLLPQPYIIHGIGVNAEPVLVISGAIILWWYSFAAYRQYRLADGSVLRKWDPSHFSLTCACLLSPVHAILILYSSLRPTGDNGIGHESQSPWILGIFVATGHAYSSLLAVHLFLQREDIQRRVHSGVYATEVTHRERQQNLRRQAERQIFERVGQPPS